MRMFHKDLRVYKAGDTQMSNYTTASTNIVRP